MVNKSHLQVASIRALIVLLPSYLAAYLTDKMVYVVPTLAAASFLAATLKFEEDDNTRRVDEDAGVDAENVDNNGPTTPTDLVS